MENGWNEVPAKFLVKLFLNLCLQKEVNYFKKQEKLLLFFYKAGKKCWKFVLPIFAID